MEWKTVKIADIIKEISMGPFGSDVKKEYYVDFGVPILNGSNLQGFKLQEESFGYLTKEKADSLGKSNAYRGDIIVTHRGTLGQIVYIPSNSKYERYVISQSQFRFRVDTSAALPEFLVYFFHTREGQYKLLSNASQVGVPALARATSTFKQLEIPIPSLTVQKHIVDALLCLDNKIENNNRINRNLEAQAQALFKSWFVDFEPWGGTMPGDWREGTLGDIIEEQPKSKIQVNAAKDVKGKYPFFTSGSSIYEYNEALISGRNLYLNTGGAAGIEFYVGEAAYSTDTWCIKGIDDFTDFLYLYITSIINIIDTEYFEGSALKHLKKKPFKERKIIIPANKIKDDFNKKVVPIFDIIMNNYSENKRLAALRDTLLPKIMKGEIAL